MCSEHVRQVRVAPRAIKHANSLLPVRHVIGFPLANATSTLQTRTRTRHFSRNSPIAGSSKLGSLLLLLLLEEQLLVELQALRRLCNTNHQSTVTTQPSPQPPIMSINPMLVLRTHAPAPQEAVPGTDPHTFHPSLRLCSARHTLQWTSRHRQGR